MGEGGLSEFFILSLNNSNGILPAVVLSKSVKIIRCQNNLLKYHFESV